MATRRNTNPAPVPSVDERIAALHAEVEAITGRAAKGREGAQKLATTIRTISGLVAREDSELGLEFSELAHEFRDELLEDAARDDHRWRLRALQIRYNDLVDAFARSRESQQTMEAPGAAQEVLDRLAGAESKTTAQLLGVDPRTLRTWRHHLPGRFKNADRLITLAAVLVELPAPGPEARLRWFLRPREALSGRTPLDLIEHDAAAAREPLVALARGSRGQLAT